ncbi:MAG: F0F1 ATP synthase subunit A [Bdellovibrionales bacterium]|nr:F0F1 ATP synthase subunit A [Bdellovibrionales bacterium]
MASGHYTWLHSLPEKIHGVSEHYADTEKFIIALMVGAGLVLLGSKATARLRGSTDIGNFLVPEKKASLFSFFDFVVETFVKYHDSVLGTHNRRYVGLTGSIFFFILFANLAGLIPGVAAATTSVWINVPIAIFVFLYFNFHGIREHGLLNYIKHFGAGTPWWIAWFIFVVEIFSTTMRVLTLNLRLYWNIFADHIVLGAFTDMTKLVVPVLFYGLGTFVSFMQAFVFTTLTMIYILLATQHEESH